MQKNQFVEELKAQLNDNLPEGFEVEERVINKNGTEMDAIVCRPTDHSKMAPIFYTDELFSVYTDGKEISELVELIINKGIETKESDESDVLENLSNKEYVKNNVYAVLLGESAKSLIEKRNLIFKPFHDMFIVYEIEVNTCGEVGRVKVSKEMADNCGLTEEEIAFYGEDNSTNKDKAVVRDMGEILGFGGTGMSYVITNESACKGAYAVFTADLKSLAEKVGKNLILLPSSIHEWIAIPENISVEEATAMIKAVNDTQVAPDDRLSYAPYYYDKDNGTFGEMK